MKDRPSLRANDLRELISALEGWFGELLLKRGGQRPLIFRGQSRASWKLKSTLERRYGPNMKVRRYLQDIDLMRRSFKALSGKAFELAEEVQGVPAPPGLFAQREYIIYLRHIGFPSPLLDWTASPYIAAYFAFAEADASSSEDVAVYVVNSLDSSGGFRMEPRHQVWRPDVVAHQRHHMQQSSYTVAFQEIEEGSWQFSNLDECQSFRARVVTMPASARRKILDDLDLMNINAFSLFASEEGLAQTLAERHLDRW